MAIPVVDMDGVAPGRTASRAPGTIRFTRMLSIPLLSHPLRYWITVAAVWAGVGTVSYFRFFLQESGQIGAWNALARLPTWILCFAGWAMLTPALSRLVQRFPIGVPFSWRDLGAHLLLCVPVTWLAMTLSVVWVWAYLWLTAGEGWEWWAPAPVELFLSVLVYWGTVAALAGLAHVRRGREQQAALAALNVQRLELESSLQEAQLHALRMKLNPHFLFNALQTISALIRTDPSAAEAIMSKLGDLLRTVLRLDLAHQIRMEEELELTRAYLEIEQARFQDRLSVSISMEEAAREALVPTLLLQPLVENAVRHGMKDSRANFLLEVQVQCRDEALSILVRDNGVGFPLQRDHVPFGVGLSNVAARLDMLYRGGSQLALRNPPAGGAEIEVQLPLRPAAALAGAR
jgi:two-component system, LytTR family, sensor kinase